MHVIDVHPNEAQSIDAAMRTEWLLSNGLGGYAMGTLLGANTRRYHGLLIASTRPPVGRIVVLHSLIEELIVPSAGGGEEAYALSTQCFGCDDRLHPGGWRHLARVSAEPPARMTWHYRIAGMEIMRRVSLERGAHAVRVQYEIANQPSTVTLRVRPFLPMRDFHSLDHRDHSRNQPRLATDNTSVEIARDGATLRISGGAFTSDAQWWNDFSYPRDRERGQEWLEDAWSPGVFTGRSQSAMRQMAEIVVELTSAPVPDQATINVADSSLSQAISETTDRRQNADWHRLAVAARQFMVARHGPQARAWTASVIAGYPWFGDWGRDTMISLPGLMLCTGRLDEAESTLACFAKHLKNGLVPNLFDDYGSAAHYNTVDASLWFVHAAHALHLARLPDTRLTREIVEACRTIIAAYRHGTDFDIRMDQADGLIVAGSPATQLTWMDAARDGVVFTPRFGKAVEINALWHNALLCMSELTEDAGERNELIMLARRVAASFRSAFWWEQRQCLHDCLTPSSSGNFEPDGQMRPNQIFAVSLPFSALNEPQHQAVVKAVGERLLTPFGLRTLDRDDPNYKPRYEGTLFERDAAYHNGTVWPWLIGAYCDSLLRVERFSGDAKRRAHETIRPLIDEMRNAAGGRCVGQIAEVYDGDPPHRPSGCPAQAWSVAEVLRILTMIGEPGR